MFKLVEWNSNLNLAEFYSEAKRRGFYNNSSKEKLVDCFNNEKEKQIWILYYNDTPIGSVAAHSFDDIMGPNSYRIAARTCVFTDKINGPYGKALRTTRVITQNQNPTAQFLIPACIEWAPKNSKLYITSNESTIGTQRRVNNIFGPLMEKHGMMKKIKTVFYRGHEQIVWEFFPDNFYEILNQYPRWK